MNELQGLARLRELSLRSTFISDAGLEKLKGLMHLRVLNLSTPRITGPNPEPDGTTAGVGVLYIGGRRVSDADREKLEALVRPRDAPGVTDAGLKYIGKLARLEVLDLSGTWVTDAGVAELEGLARLRELNLSALGITDAGLDHVVKMARLESLNLGGTRVTDRGLVRLLELGELRSLTVSGAGVTAEGVRRLRAALPQCAISSEFSLVPLQVAPGVGREIGVRLPASPFDIDRGTEEYAPTIPFDINPGTEGQATKNGSH